MIGVLQTEIDNTKVCCWISCYGTPHIREFDIKDNIIRKEVE